MDICEKCGMRGATCTHISGVPITEYVAKSDLRKLEEEMGVVEAVNSDTSYVRTDIDSIRARVIAGEARFWRKKIEKLIEDK